ncbi:glutamate--tRNA ligase family protein [Croceimicrobium sp.]|uniref:glutamate--tRNA ligase family protein n=1 Tax=Croceimicrobium sp. TaxID=2828340 RepID=UPI003BAC7E24
MQFKAKTRIAPTPSGYLHQGNLFAFALTWLMARKEGLSILLRIDDLDRARYRVEYLEDVFRSLDILGIDYNEGPSGIEDFEKNWSQELRLDLYHSALHQLKYQKQVFACDCSRKDILELNPEGIYPGTCLNRNLSLDNPDFAWRWKKNSGHFKIKAWSGNSHSEDFPQAMHYTVLKSKAGHPSYQMASLIDDVHFKISHIVRGEDLWDSSLFQMALAQELKLKSFEAIHFHHHPLIRREGEKLSKSQSAPAAKIYQNPQAQKKLFQNLSRYLGLKESPDSLTELLALYSQSGSEA